MSQPRPWLDEVIDALEELKGQGKLADIYATILKRKVMSFAAPNWEALVRKTIEQHSSDSEAFTGKVGDDLFYAPNGKGEGYWAIRDYEATARDIDSKVIEESNGISEYEGAPVQRYVSAYERRPALRAAAIHIHGLICKGCGFNFEATYGLWGKGYIEVHHLRPISTLDGPTLVSPDKDLTVLCSNCHRIVHRRQDKVLSLEALQALVAAQRAKS